MQEARRLWLAAQRLDRTTPFGAGVEAVHDAVRHLGYVQIDTINVIERCHHHILWSRIPAYRRADLASAQSGQKTVFEYWTHALSYVPTEDWRYFRSAMQRHRVAPHAWFSAVTPREVRKVLERIRDGGPLSIRDIDDDVLVEKDHAWASRKPSKRVLQWAFYMGALTVSARAGMLKTYELTERHFGWEALPRAASERQVLDYMIDRALKSQGVISLESVCHLDAGRKGAVRALIEARVGRRLLRPVTLQGAERFEHWVAPSAFEDPPDPEGEPVHLLSPFDPLVIQRRRLALLFGYEHRFEAYVPREKRVFGYFALPVLIGDRIVAALDLKTDRAGQRLLVQQWSWIGAESPGDKARIEEALHRFERFQLGAAVAGTAGEDARSRLGEPALDSGTGQPAARDRNLHLLQK